MDHNIDESSNLLTKITRKSWWWRIIIKFFWTFMILIFITQFCLVCTNLSLLNIINDKVQASTSTLKPEDAKVIIHCDNVIVGAGIGGMYLAYKLGELYHEQVCVIEKNYYGGRIKDIQTALGNFGTGALRITLQHPNMMVLKNKFNIDLEPVQEEVEALKVRGQNYYKYYANQSLSQVNKMCKERYFLNTCGNETLDADDYFIQQLANIYYEKLQNNQTAQAEFADMHTFTSAILGDEGAKLLTEASRLNIFIESSSIEAFFEFLEDEPTGRGSLSYRQYPKGGMSTFIKALFEAATNQKVRFYNETVTSIYSALTKDEPYIVSTQNKRFVTGNVMIAVPPVQLAKISGNIVENIINMPQFNLIVPVKVATVAAWFPTPWWENLSVKFSRVVTRQICFNVMEVIPTNYLKPMNVIRVVYDEWNCVDSWEKLIQSPKDKLIQEVMRGLQAMFPNVSIPTPTRVEGMVWEDGWHFNRGSNKLVEDWAVQPISEHKISLIGSAYNIRWNVWTEGAIVSAMNALVKYYKFTFDKCPCSLVSDKECYFPDKWPCISSGQWEVPWKTRHRTGW